ncbi:MAG: hypothetical protein ACYCSS_13910 [Sulfuriferula sp.]
MLSKYLPAVLGVVALILATIGLILQLSGPSAPLNFFSLVALALSGDVNALVLMRRYNRRQIGWILFALLTNAPLVIAIVKKALGA